MSKFIKMMRRLLKSGLDFDSNARDVSPDSYTDALNIHNGVGAKGKYFIPQNIEGNRLVNFQLPSGTNKVVGWLEDFENNTLIYWVQNSNGDDSILRWYPTTNLVIPILQEKLGLTTQFSGRNLVNDLLSWTDGAVPQRSVNIDRAQRQDENGVFKKVKFNIYFDFVNFRNGDRYSITFTDVNGNPQNIVVYTSASDQTLQAGIADFVTQFNANQSFFTATSCEQFIEVEGNVPQMYDVQLVIDTNTVTALPSSGAVRVFTNIYPDGFLETFINADFNPPICEPAVKVLTDSTKNTNFIVSKIFQFRLAYKGVDAQQSSLSPISLVSLGVGNYVEIDFTSSRLNDENLTIIKGVQIYVKQGELGKWSFVTELERFQFGVGRNYFKFYNDQAYNAVDDAFAVKLFESIPITSEAQEVADNRMMYGGNKEGYDPECVDLSLNVNFKKPPQLYKIKGIVVIRPLFVTTTTPSTIRNSAIFVNADGTYTFSSNVLVQVTPGHLGTDIPLAGFTFYLAGTEFYGVSRQKQTTSNGSEQDGTGAYHNTTAGRTVWLAQNNLPYSAFKSNDPFGFGNSSRDQNGSYIGDKFFSGQDHGTDVYSFFEIDGVPEGEYILRIGGAETTASDLSNTGYQHTSTYTMAVGTATDGMAQPQGFEYKIKVGANVISHDAVIASQSNNEIYVGCSAVADPASGFSSATLVTGYFCDQDFPDGSPHPVPTTYAGLLECTRIERALVGFITTPAAPPDLYRFNTVPPFWSQRAWSVANSAVTDHNGFFYYIASTATTISGVFVGSTGGGFTANLAQLFKEDNTAILPNATFTGYARIAIRQDNNNITERRKTFVTGTITDAGVPQANVAVTVELGATVRTDQNGLFKIPYYCDTFYSTLIINTTGQDPVRIGNVVFSSINNFIVYDFFPDDEDFIGVFPTGITIGAGIGSYNNITPTGWYQLFNSITADLLEQFQSISAWKRGLNETFAVIYYDRENRQTTVQEHIRDIYVPFYTENQQTGFAIIDWAISSLPPDWATHYQIVRKHTVPSFLQINAQRVTAGGSAVEYLDNFTKVRIYTESISEYHNRYLNAQLNYTWEQGDRIRLISNGAGNLFTTYQDAEIVFQEPTGQYIQVDINNVNFRPDVGTLFEIYTPKPAQQTQYYEFGECYEIYELNGVKYHRGSTQDQTATQPATGTFKSGDVYYRFRNFVLGGAKYIEDSSANDFYESFTTQTGRPQILDKNYKQRFQAGQIRISNPYFTDTLQNGFPSFEALNFNFDIEPPFGIIQVMKLMSQSVLLVVCQHRTQPFYVGSAVIKTTTGSNLIAVADNILNHADTLVGQRGTQHKQSFDSYNNNAWWFDSSKGVMVRYSTNGLEDYSRYGAKSYFIQQGNKNFKNVTTVFDPEHNTVITCFETQDGVIGDAIAFNDAVVGGKDRFVTRFSFNPEMMGRVGNQLLMFKDGELWINDSPVRNNFFGIQYTSQVKIVANDEPSATKSFQAITEEARYAWSLTGTTPPNNTASNGQATRLLKNKFKKSEGKWKSEILNSLLTANRTPIDGLINGDKMRGEIMELEFNNDETVYSELYCIDIFYIDSPLNPQ